MTFILSSVVFVGLVVVALMLRNTSRELAQLEIEFDLVLQRESESKKAMAGLRRSSEFQMRRAESMQQKSWELLENLSELHEKGADALCESDSEPTSGADV